MTSQPKFELSITQIRVWIITVATAPSRWNFDDLPDYTVAHARRHWSAYSVCSQKLPVPRYDVRLEFCVHQRTAEFLSRCRQEAGRELWLIFVCSFQFYTSENLRVQFFWKYDKSESHVFTLPQKIGFAQHWKRIYTLARSILAKVEYALRWPITVLLGAERVGASVSVLTHISEGYHFKSRPGDELLWVRLSVWLLSNPPGRLRHSTSARPRRLASKSFTIHSSVILLSYTALK
jgi:hypothetical protein